MAVIRQAHSDRDRSHHWILAPCGASMGGWREAIAAGTGIDSIKKVEILSGIQERLPDLPEINLQEVSSLRTIGEIAEYLKSHGMV